MPKDPKDTLNLPKTDFPMRANLVEREPLRVAHWEKSDLYARIQANNQGKPLFVLHDGPPFTNGDVHIGTALNKTLKDAIVRYKSMRGYRAPYLPGWDCHGLPIEHKVSRQLRETNRQLTTAELRRECEKFSRQFIETQRAQFKRLGVLADWANEYKTLNPEYEATILRTFAAFVRQGLVYRSKKPIYWSIPCETALAEAEIEYRDHVSPSIYVAFKVTDPRQSGLPANTEIVIWTTTPWTIPANLAIALHPRLQYLTLPYQGRNLLVARDLAPQLASLLEIEDLSPSQPTFLGSDLEGVQTVHPFINRPSPLVLADYVTTETGTGCVHTAPGHGMEDYLTGLRYNLEIYCPLDDQGAYLDDGSIPASLVGKSVLETDQQTSPANRAVLSLLKETGSLLSVKKYHHSYPHCWRSKTPVVFRAMDQWFVSLDRDGLRDQVLTNLQKVRWEPSWGENRIRGSVENRPDWCISRQRAWGVPIPAFFDPASGDCLLDPEVIEALAGKVALHGTSIWFEQDAAQLLDGIPLPAGWQDRDLVTGKDTLDVWIDSGCSHRAVLQNHPDLHWPADLYLEGSDQHRGWFQSSLWTATIADRAAPYRQIITHGFVVGGDGQKISKSDGKPQTADGYVNTFGADVVRLWIASEDFRNDIPVSDEILKHVSQTYRLIRNSLRFQLSNLYDFDPAQDQVDPADLDPLDQWALAETTKLVVAVTAAYDRFEFHRAYQEINRFFSNTLSATYHDILKDRLYTLAPQHPLRRSSQTALHEILFTVSRLLAPLLPFTTDEVWSHGFEGRDLGEDSIHLQPWPEPILARIEHPSAQHVSALLNFKATLINEQLETLRVEKKIGQSLDAALEIFVSPDHPACRALEELEEKLPELFIVSLVKVVRSDHTAVRAQPASGIRCPRCWRTVSHLVTNPDPDAPEVCSRCAEALEAIAVS
ncbi:MAG: isoleucine--tRNA ligase [Puniceicoccaceae bacterium]